MTRQKSFLLLAITFLGFALLIPRAHAAVEISDGSIKALYHFNNQDLADSSGNGHNGTDSGMTYTSTSTKLGTYAASTGDGTSFFTIPSNAWDTTGDFTMGFWLNPGESLGSGIHIWQANSASHPVIGVTYSLECTANHIEFTHRQTCIIDTAQTFATSTWYWILAERKGTNVDFYVNDTLVQNATDSSASTTLDAIYANGDAARSTHKKMFLDEMFFSTTAITTSTRDALWNNGDGAEICTLTGCANDPIEMSDGSVTGLYHFNGSSPVDSSSNGRDGTLFGSGGGYTTTSTFLGAAAFSSDGSGNSQLSMPSSSMDTSGDFTMAEWIKPTVDLTSGGADLLGKTTGSASSAEEISYGLNCTANHIEWYRGGVCIIDAPYSFQTGTYYLVLLERNGSHEDLYIGSTTSTALTLLATGTDASSTNTASSTHIDNSGCLCQKAMFVDEVVLMNKAMTTSTRNAFWNNGNGVEMCATVGCGPGLKIVAGTLAQYESSTASIPEGATTFNNTVKFAATLSAIANDPLELQVEVRATSTSFTGVPTATSGAVLVGNVASTTVTLVNGAYHWQARVRDTLTNATSSWQEFGAVGNTDFVVSHIVEISDGSVTGLYHFNALSAIDSSGSGRDGTLSGIGGGYTTTSTFLGAAAFSSDGSGKSQLSVPSSSMDISGDFTMAEWMKPTVDLTSGVDLFGKTTGSASSAEEISYGLNCTASHIEWYRAGICVIDTPYTFQTNTYYLILLERNGTHVDMYVGSATSTSLTLLASGTDSDTTNTASSTHIDNSGCLCQKAMFVDEVVLMNKAMTTSTRNSLFYAGAGAEVCTTTGCGPVEISDGSIKSLYHFDGQTVTDSSGNGYNGNSTSTMGYTSTSTRIGAYAATTGDGSSFFATSHNAWNTSGDFTIGFWMQPQESFGAGIHIWQSSTPSTPNTTGITYSLECTANHIEFVHHQTCLIDSAQTLNTGTWYWVVIERKGTSLDSYINDSLLQHATDSSTSTNTDLLYVNGDAVRSTYKKMFLDEMFFSTAAITTSTRDALYNSGNGREMCVTIGCGD